MPVLHEEPVHMRNRSPSIELVEQRSAVRYRMEPEPVYQSVELPPPRQAAQRQFLPLITNTSHHPHPRSVYSQGVEPFHRSQVVQSSHPQSNPSEFVQRVEPRHDDHQAYTHRHSTPGPRRLSGEVIDLTSSPMGPRREQKPFYIMQSYPSSDRAGPHSGVRGLSVMTPLVHPLRGGGDFHGASRAWNDERAVDVEGDNRLSMHQRVSSGGVLVEDRARFYRDDYADSFHRRPVTRGVRPVEPTLVTHPDPAHLEHRDYAPHPEIPASGWVQFESNHNRAPVR